MSNEMENTGTTIEQPPDRPNVGSIATPGSGTRVSAGPFEQPAKTGSPKSRGFIPSAGARIAGLKEGTEAFRLAKNRYNAEYKAWQRQQGSAGTNQGQAPRKTAAKGGRPASRPAASPKQTASDFPQLVVDAPKDVSMGGDIPKLEILPTIQAVLQFGADSYSMSRPLIDIQMFPEIAMHGPQILQKLWKFSPAEIDTVAIPVANMIPELPPKYLRVVEKSLNPLALIAGIFALIVPRVQQEREILNAIRQYNAGTHAQAVQPQGGQNTPNPASNGNSAAPPDTRVHDLPPNPYAAG